MSWFIKIADFDYSTLGVSDDVVMYLKNLNDWDRGISIELIKRLHTKSVIELQGNLKLYKSLISTSANIVPKKFIFQVFSWVKNGSLRLPEDYPRLSRAINYFMKNITKLQKQNINQYRTFNELEDITSQDDRSNRQVTKDIRMNGSRDVYSDKEWRVIEMTTPEAVCELGKGTRWCTNSDNDGFETAEDYLKSGPLYLFLRNTGKWEKYAQSTKDLSSFMDVTDRTIKNIPASLVAVLKQLIKNGVFNEIHFFEEIVSQNNYPGIDKDFVSWFMEEMKDNKFPSSVFDKIMYNIGDFRRRLPLVESEIIFKPISSDQDLIEKTGTFDGRRIEKYFEALNIKTRWQDKEQENAIANSSYALDYWKDILVEYNYGKMKPGAGDYQKWEEYEQAMLQNPRRAEELVHYLYLLNGDKRAGEPYESYLLNSIKDKKLDNFDNCFDYAKNCHMRWPELEKILLSGNNVLELPIYAHMVVKGRWAEAEPIILKEPYVGYLYTMNVMGGQRWPELEQEIIKKQDGNVAAYYAISVLKQRWNKMEPYILKGWDTNVVYRYKKTFGIKEAITNDWYSRVKKADFPQYDVFHGTGNTKPIYDQGFVYNYIKESNDQYGPGFYFTTNEQTASRYGQKTQNYREERKETRDSPGVIKAQVMLKKPIRSDGQIDSGVFDIFPKLNYYQTKQVIKLAIELQGPNVLENWGDLQSEDENILIDKATLSYNNRSSAFLMYDLFSNNNITKFLETLNKMTGYDGVVANMSGEQWVVAWFPNQIKVVR